MARNFTASSSQYAATAGIVVATTPQTMGFWATTPVTANTEQSILCQWGSSTHFIDMSGNNITGPGATRRFRVRIQANLTGVVLDATGAPTGWNHVVYVKRTFGQRHRLYLNGVLAASSTTACNPTLSSGTTYVARRGSPTQHWDGSVEWPFIIPAMLSPLEVSCMSRNGPPWMTRPDVYAGGAGACWPMIGGDSPEPNLMGLGVHDLTLYNSPPRVLGAPVSIPNGLMVA